MKIEKNEIVFFLLAKCWSGTPWWKQLNPKGVHGYFDFYSNSIEVAVTIWSLLNCYLVFFPDSHRVTYAITAGFNAIAPTAAAYLCFCYWAFSSGLSNLQFLKKKSFLLQLLTYWEFQWYIQSIWYRNKISVPLEFSIF